MKKIEDKFSKVDEKFTEMDEKVENMNVLFGYLYVKSQENSRKIDQILEMLSKK